MYDVYLLAVNYEAFRTSRPERTVCMPDATCFTLPGLITTHKPASTRCRRHHKTLITLTEEYTRTGIWYLIHQNNDGHDGLLESPVYGALRRTWSVGITLQL